MEGDPLERVRSDLAGSLTLCRACMLTPGNRGQHAEAHERRRRGSTEAKTDEEDTSKGEKTKRGTTYGTPGNTGLVVNGPYSTADTLEVEWIRRSLPVTADRRPATTARRGRWTERCIGREKGEISGSRKPKGVTGMKQGWNGCRWKEAARG